MSLCNPASSGLDRRAACNWGTALSNSFCAMYRRPAAWSAEADCSFDAASSKRAAERSRAR